MLLLSPQKAREGNLLIRRNNLLDEIRLLANYFAFPFIESFREISFLNFGFWQLFYRKSWQLFYRKSYLQRKKKRFKTSEKQLSWFINCLFWLFVLINYLDFNKGPQPTDPWAGRPEVLPSILYPPMPHLQTSNPSKPRLESKVVKGNAKRIRKLKNSRSPLKTPSKSNPIQLRILTIQNCWCICYP